MKQFTFIFLFLLSNFLFCLAQKTDDLNLTAMIQPADADLFVRDSLYFNWCNSVVKADDGIYHLFYARWPKSTGFSSWLTHSEIAHATALQPDGPYCNGKTILKARKNSWDMIMVHNVQVNKFGKKYYLYYISTNTRNYSDCALKEMETDKYRHILRSNQRTGVATAMSLDGPWRRESQPMIEPHGAIKTITVNPSVCQGKDGRYFLIIKGDDRYSSKRRLIQAIGISQTPIGPFYLKDKSAYSDIETEDICLWYDEIRERFYAVFHAQGDDFIGLITSADGINWKKAMHYEVCKKQILLKDGTIMKVDRMERPYVYLEKGIPTMISFGVKRGNDAFVVFLRLNLLVKSH